MKSLKILVAVAVLAPSLAFAQGMRNSLHDLSSSTTSTSGIKAAAGNNEICKFCHTPHRAQSTSLLWFHTQTGVTITGWGNDLDGTALTKTFAGTSLPTAGLKNASKRCLGCHDGTIALGSTTTGAPATTVVISVPQVASKVDAAGKLIETQYVMGASGSMGSHHPVSIPYAGQTYNTFVSKAVANDTAGTGAYFTVKSAACTSPSTFCTNAIAGDGRNGNNINLLPNAPGGAAGTLGIECTSCHDPHNGTGFANFLRVDNASASGLCRSCHNK